MFGSLIISSQIKSTAMRAEEGTAGIEKLGSSDSGDPKELPMPSHANRYDYLCRLLLLVPADLIPFVYRPK